MRTEALLNAIKVMEEKIAAGRVDGGIAGFPTLAERYEQDFETIIKAAGIPRGVGEAMYYMGCATLFKMVNEITAGVAKGLYTEEQGERLYAGIHDEIKLTSLREMAKAVVEVERRNGGE